jgi:hypothetical protein
MIKRKIEAGVSVGEFKRRLIAILNEEAKDPKSRIFHDGAFTSRTNILDVLDDLVICRRLGKGMRDLARFGVPGESVCIERFCNKKQKTWSAYAARSFEDIGGTNVLWLEAYGCGRAPIAFAVYFDEKHDLRAYVPKNGNLYCHACNKAYGHEVVGNSCESCASAAWLCTFKAENDEDNETIRRICKECGCRYPGNGHNISDIKENDRRMSEEVRSVFSIVDAAGGVLPPARLSHRRRKR